VAVTWPKQKRLPLELQFSESRGPHQVEVSNEILLVSSWRVDGMEDHLFSGTVIRVRQSVSEGF
jgi:hypothetical protein